MKPALPVGFDSVCEREREEQQPAQRNNDQHSNGPANLLEKDQVLAVDLANAGGDALVHRRQVPAMSRAGYVTQRAGGGQGARTLFVSPRRQQERRVGENVAGPGAASRGKTHADTRAQRQPPSRAEPRPPTMAH